jgi:hypothetical protein
MQLITMKQLVKLFLLTNKIIDEYNESGMNNRNTSTLIVLASPIIIMIIGNIAARIFMDLFGKWAWIGGSKLKCSTFS